MRIVVAVLSVLLAGLNGLHTAKIAMMPMLGQHHFKVFSLLGEELQQRGHKVTLFVGDEAGQTNDNRMTQVFTTNNGNKINQFIQGESQLKGTLPIVRVLNLFSLQIDYCDAFLNDQKVLHELSTAEILVGDTMYACSALVAAKFNIPHVVLDGSPSTYAQKLLAKFPELYGGPLGNWHYYVGRLLIWGMGLGSLEQGYDEIKKKYEIKSEEEIWETLYKADLVLVEKISTDYTTPLPPYARIVGSLVSGQGESLPSDLQGFITSSNLDGVVIVSIDTHVSKKSTEMIHMALSKLPQKVIWKGKGKFEGTLSSNIKTVQLLPQNILGHSKIKLLITDGLASMVSEAVSHGIPLICLCSHSNQFNNAQSLQKLGVGNIVDLNNATSEEMVVLINQVIHEKRYKENAIDLSQIMNLRPRTPLQKAAEMIESVHVVGNQACDLEQKSLGLSGSNRLDAFLGSGVILTLVLAIVKRMIEICNGQSEKTKTS